MRKKLLAVSFSAACLTLAVIACNSEGPTTPPNTDSIVRAPETPTVTAPAPAPVTTPTPAPDKAWEVWGTSKSVLHVAYSGEATYAEYETYYTSFDDQTTKFGVQKHNIKRGDEQTREFSGVCIQTDAEQVGVKPIGAAFFDKNGDPFNPSRNPEKVAECRRGTPTPPPQCEENGEPNTTYGQYSWAEAILEGKCEQEVLPVVYEDTVTPALNCHQTGSQSYTTDLKCSEDRTGTRNLCRNVACPTPPPTCQNYDAPSTTVTGSPATSATGFTGIGTILPIGGTFTPALPLLGTQPEYGQPAVTLSTTYSKVLNYGPENLKCSVTASKTFTFTLEPKSCGVSNPPGFFDQSEQDNNNNIKWNVHVRNDGVWVLKLYATSSISEYNNNDPDFTKDTDSATLQCKGEGELKVDYNWKDHQSEYWWAVLTRNGVTVWKSSYVQNYTN